jgi:hypothetical protein
VREEGERKMNGRKRGKILDISFMPPRRRPVYSSLLEFLEGLSPVNTDFIYRKYEFHL